MKTTLTEKGNVFSRYINGFLNFRSKVGLSVLVILTATVLIFKGSFDYGLNFDNVLRLNNLIPLFNDKAFPVNQSIYSINLFGKSIPIMYKEYISSMYVLKYLPLGFFNNYLFGLRFLDMFYFALAIIGTFIIVSKYNFKYALALTALIITSPIYYPEVLFAFLNIDFLFFVTLSLHFFYKYFNKSNKLYDLFIAVFAISFCANLLFFTIWIITALCISSLIFLTTYWKKVFSSFSKLVVVVAGVVLGLFNFVMYNVTKGFPTFKPIINRLFKPKEFHPIDYSPVRPFKEDIATKLHTLASFFGREVFVYLLVICILMLIYFVIFYKLKKLNKLSEYKLCFFPLVTLVFIIGLILISPKTSLRAEHWAYMSPFFETIILVPAFIASKIFNLKSIFRKITIAIPIIFILINVVGLMQAVSFANKTKGTGYLSPAVYDLDKYIKQNNISFHDIVFIEWGLYSQLYFLNKGETEINSLVFQLLEAPTEKGKFDVLKTFFLSNEGNTADDLYFPIYFNLDKKTRDAFFDLIKQYDGKLTEVKTFYEYNKSKVFGLYKLDNKEIVEEIKNDLVNAPTSDNQKILNYGPRAIKSKDLNNFAMWFITSGHTVNTKIVINDTVLETVYTKDHLTAAIPKNIVKNTGSYKIQLYDTAQEVKSKPVYLTVK